MTLPMPIYNVYNAARAKGARYSTLSDILRPLVALVILFTTSLLWAFYSKNDVITQDPRLYYYTVGTIFSNVSVSHLVIPYPFGQTSIELLTNGRNSTILRHQPVSPDYLSNVQDQM